MQGMQGMPGMPGMQGPQTFQQQYTVYPMSLMKPNWDDGNKSAQHARCRLSARARSAQDLTLLRGRACVRSHSSTVSVRSDRCGAGRE
jgi:hypothetical protein